MTSLLKKRTIKNKDLISEDLHDTFTKFYNFFTNSTLTKKQVLNLTEPVSENLPEAEDNLDKNMSVTQIFLSLQLDKKSEFNPCIHYFDFIQALSSKNFPKRMIYLFLLAYTKTKLGIKKKITKEEKEILSLLPNLSKMSYPDRIEFFDAGLKNLPYPQFRVFLKLPYNYIINQIDRCKTYEDFCQIRKKITFLNQDSYYETLFQQELSENLWIYDHNTSQYKRPTIELKIGKKVLSI